MGVFTQCHFLGKLVWQVVFATNLAFTILTQLFEENRSIHPGFKTEFAIKYSATYWKPLSGFEKSMTDLTKMYLQSHFPNRNWILLHPESSTCGRANGKSGVAGLQLVRCSGSTTARISFSQMCTKPFHQAFISPLASILKISLMFAGTHTTAESGLLEIVLPMLP